MIKNIHFHLKLPSDFAPLVEKGSLVKKGDKIAEKKVNPDSIFNLSQILGVKAKDLPQSLSVSEGSFLEANDVIARKKGLFRESIVRTPVSGLFKIIDKEKGLVAIVARDSPEFISQLTGKVIDVNPDSIYLEISGFQISGKSGKGNPVYGKILFLEEFADFLNLNNDVENCVLVVRHAESSMIAKADALGVSAIVAQSLELPDFSLPYLEVADISTISPYNGKIVVVHGDEKLMVVVNN